mmetsp:Transcript_6124/g.11980  ORF Transcript_6124/g.11980 Transcript_6124/m.11980 type:complete len:172 (+) Transcript_6124:635-1150(+)
MKRGMLDGACFMNPLFKVRRMDGKSKSKMKFPLVIVLVWVMMMMMMMTVGKEQESMATYSFHVVIFTCLWKRPVLSDFVLGYYARLSDQLWREEGLRLSMFIVGSEGEKSRELATRHGAGYLEYRNEPLGEKHNAGLLGVRDKYPDLDAVVVVRGRLRKWFYLVSSLDQST